MRSVKTVTCLLIFVVFFVSWSTYSTDSCGILNNEKRPLPKNSYNLSLKEHWQYIGYYLYKLLDKNTSFSDKSRREIDKLFGTNQRIIDELYPSNNRNIYRFSLNGVIFENTETDDNRIKTKFTLNMQGCLNSYNDDTSLENEKNKEASSDALPSDQKVEGAVPAEGVAPAEGAVPPPEGTEGSTTPDATMALPEVATILPDGSTQTADENIQPPDSNAQLSDSGQLPTALDFSANQAPLYGQMGMQSMSPASGYGGTISDPNIISANDTANMYNNAAYNAGGYGISDNVPAYGMVNQNYDRTSRNGGLNSYSNLSDFEAVNQGTGASYPPQGQEGWQNTYNETGVMDDSQQYGNIINDNGMPPQYGNTQPQSYDNGSTDQEGMMEVAGNNNEQLVEDNSQPNNNGQVYNPDNTEGRTPGTPQQRNADRLAEEYQSEEVSYNTENGEGEKSGEYANNHGNYAQPQEVDSSKTYTNESNISENSQTLNQKHFRDGNNQQADQHMMTQYQHNERQRSGVSYSDVNTHAETSIGYQPKQKMRMPSVQSRNYTGQEIMHNTSSEAATVESVESTANRAPISHHQPSAFQQQANSHGMEGVKMRAAIQSQNLETISFADKILSAKSPASMESEWWDPQGDTSVWTIDEGTDFDENYQNTPLTSKDF